MGIKVRGGCWCAQCDGPVTAVKSTHRLRNTAVTVAAPVTYGASLAGARVDGWVCSTCGGPVLEIPDPPRPANPVVRFVTAIGGVYLAFWVVVFLLIVLAGGLAIIDTIARLL